MKASKDIDTYIASYPQKTQVLLKKMRAVICKAAPQATEAISYDPTPASLIGALHRKGVSVAQLAKAKRFDLRSTTAWQNLQRCGAVSHRKATIIWPGPYPSIFDAGFGFGFVISALMAPMPFCSLPVGSVGTQLCFRLRETENRLLGGQCNLDL